MVILFQHGYKEKGGYTQKSSEYINSKFVLEKGM